MKSCDTGHISLLAIHVVMISFWCKACFKIIHSICDCYRSYRALIYRVPRHRNKPWNHCTGALPRDVCICRMVHCVYQFGGWYNLYFNTLDWIKISCKFIFIHTFMFLILEFFQGKCKYGSGRTCKSWKVCWINNSEHVFTASVKFSFVNRFVSVQNNWNCAVVH